MDVQARFAAYAVLVAAFCFPGNSGAQGGDAGAELQRRYDAAQRFQQEGKSDKAAQEYRTFLALAQEELAAGYIASGDFARAATLAQSVLSEPPADSELRANAHQALGRALHKQNQDREAKAEFEKAVDLDPSFANRYDLAVACLDLDDDKCASQAFGEIESSFSDTPALHMQIGLAYGNSDFIPKAIAEFQKAIAEDPRFPRAHYCLAAALLDSGDDQKNGPEAEAELKKELEISPHDALTYAALGKLAVADHRTAEAESYLKTATSLDPRNPDAFLYLGQLYSDTGRIADAEAALRKSIALTTDPSRNRFQIQKTHFLLGRILMQEHRPAEAHAEMELSRKFADKDLSHDKGELAGLLSNSSATGAAASALTSSANAANNANAASPADSAALHALEKHLAPAIADSYNNLGVIAATAGQYAEAFADFNHAAEWNPALDGLDLNRGRAAFMASMFADAIPPLSHYVSTHPRDSGVRGALAVSQFMTHDFSDCVKTLKGVQGQGIDAQIASIPQMAYIFADSLVHTGQTTEGTKRLEALEAAHPEIPDVHRALGEVYAAGHNREKAGQELHTALVLNNSDAQAHYDLGKLTLERGSAATAIPELEAAIRLAPNDPAFHRELALAYGLASRKEDAQRETGISEKLASAARAEQPGTGNGGIH